MSINFTSLATSALGFTLALAWNDAVVKTISSTSARIAPSPENEAHMSFVYAAVVTVLVLVIVVVANCGRKIYLKLHGKNDATPRSTEAVRDPQTQIVRLW